MSGSWLIIRTEHSKEQYVERQIANMGYASWCPLEVRFHRIDGSSPQGRHRRPRVWDEPLLRTVVFAAVPMAVHGLLHSIDGFDHLQRPTPLSDPYTVPDEQIDIFRGMVDQENAMRRRMVHRQQIGKKGNRSIKVKGFGEHALSILMEELFGIERLQEAA